MYKKRRIVLEDDMDSDVNPLDNSGKSVEKRARWEKMTRKKPILLPFLHEDIEIIVEKICQGVELRVIQNSDFPFLSTEEFIANNFALCYKVVTFVDPSSEQHILKVLGTAQCWEKCTQLIIGIFKTQQDSTSYTGSHFLREEEKLVMESDDFERKLKDFLLKDVPSEQLYPIGNLSVGLAVNYYDAAKVLLCSEFTKRYNDKCTELEASTAKSYERVQKTVIIIPADCSIKRNLGEYGADFQRKHDVILPKEAYDGAPRDFTIAMFELNDGDKTYLVRVEVPNIITTIDKLTETNTDFTEHLSQVPRLSEDQRDAHRDEFKRELIRLLRRKHTNDYIMVDFDANKDDLKQVVLTAVKSDATSQPPKIHCTAVVIRPEGTMEEELCDKFEHELQAKGIKVVRKFSPTGSAFAEAAAEAKACKETGGVMFLLITNDEVQDIQKRRLSEILQSQDISGRMEIIPVYVNCKHENVKGYMHEYLRQIQSLEICSPFDNADNAVAMQKALKVCTGEIALSYPLGPVYQGLAWAFTLNYLCVALKGKVTTLKEEQKSNEGQGIILFPKQLLLAEKLCRTVRDKKFSDFKNIEQVEVASHERQEAGTKRVYSTSIFKITHNGKVYIAALEYVRALASLGNLEKSMQAHITPKVLNDQYENFSTYIVEIIDRIPLLKDNCCYCMFNEDDFKDENGELDLARAIGEFLESQMST